MNLHFMRVSTLIIIIFFTLSVGSVISSQDDDIEINELIKVIESGDNFSSSYSVNLKLENHLSNGEIFDIKFKMSGVFNSPLFQYS